MDERIRRNYFEWICRLVMDERVAQFGELLEFLFNKPFVYIIPRDGNREADGIELRYRFGKEQGVPQAIIANELDVIPCSILEMMVALCLRCEENIMDDPDEGNRSPIWLWFMFRNLGLQDMDDRHFDRRRVERVTNRFLSGESSLFIIPGTDLRGMEIWYQAMRWFDAYLKGEI